jgi:hypothetical protein
MVMIRPGGKPKKIVQKILKERGVALPKKGKKGKSEPLTGPYLQH